MGRGEESPVTSHQDIDTSIVTDEAAAVSTTSTSILYLSLSLLFICSKLFLCFADKWSECSVILEVSATVLTTGDPPLAAAGEQMGWCRAAGSNRGALCSPAQSHVPCPATGVSAASPSQPRVGPPMHQYFACILSAVRPFWFFLLSFVKIRKQRRPWY